MSSVTTALCIVVALLVLQVDSLIPHCQTDEDCGAAVYCAVKTHRCQCRRGHFRLSGNGGGGSDGGDGCHVEMLKCSSSAQCRQYGDSSSCVNGRCVVNPAPQQEPPDPMPFDPPPDVIRSVNPGIWSKRSKASSSTSSSTSPSTTKVRQQPAPATTLAGPISVGLLVFFSFAILMVTMAYRCSFRLRHMEQLERTESPLQVLRSTSRTPSLPSYNSLNPPSYEEATARSYSETADYQRLQALREEAPSPPLKNANFGDQEKDTPPTYSDMPMKLSSISVVDLREESIYFPALPAQLLWDEQDPGDLLKTCTDPEEHKAPMATETSSEFYAAENINYSENEKNDPPTYSEPSVNVSSVSVVDLRERSPTFPSLLHELSQDGPSNLLRNARDTEGPQAPTAAWGNEEFFALRNLMTLDNDETGDTKEKGTKSGRSSPCSNNVSIHL
ncbi:uncharacterized protein LOC143038057 [Oratosquilla oratoria]|uniref:uncharacterized protein LOC143038057 n=1 Tax=Oratosquilla oratoria TaxID=337810 RepID=UPI003F76C5F2